MAEPKGPSYPHLEVTTCGLLASGSLITAGESPRALFASDTAVRFLCFSYVQFELILTLVLWEFG